MSKKLKNLILFGIFIVILFLSTVSSAFDTDVLWSNGEENRKFGGLLFKNPVEISDLVVSRTIEEENNKNLVRYDVNFKFSGTESSLRILGLPAKQVFLNNGIVPRHSVVKLKGDYDKINEQLFENKLKHSELYKKVKDFNYNASSEIRVPLNGEVEEYSFSIYYKPDELVYNDKHVVAENTVFITNARVNKFVNASKDIEGDNPTFSQSGFYVNAQEIINGGTISRISLLNNVDSVVFVVAIIGVLILIWLENKKFEKFYSLLYLIILFTFYRFLGLGSSAIGVLVIYPILGYIACLFAKLMTKEGYKGIKKKEYKQCLGIDILFYVISIIIVLIPRVF